MQQTLIKKIILVFTTLLIIVSCVSCKAKDELLLSDYLNTLANKAGFSNNDDIKQNCELLYQWGVIESLDSLELDKPVTYEKIIMTFVSIAECDEKQLASIVDVDLIKTLNKEDVYKQIDCLVSYLNNKPITSKYDYSYKNTVKDFAEVNDDGDIYYDLDENQFYVLDKDSLREAEFEEVFDYINLEDCYEIDLDKAEVTPANKENQLYTNNNFNLIATKTHSFNSKGFRISYTLNSSTISVHISKNVDGVNFYGDLAISNIKPIYKWLYEKGDLKNAYFKVNFNSTEKIGCSIGKYSNYIADFSNIDGNSFLEKLNSIFVKDNDEIEASIPICSIKTPIGSIPSVYLNMDLVAKVYVNGRIELQFYNQNILGFETKNGVLRMIDESTKDYDGIISGSGKACLGINFNIEAAKQRLMDIEFDGGLRAQLKSTLHLYNDKGEKTTVESDVPYSIIEELSKLNENVLLCGDISLHWLFDIRANTYKTLMYKLGFNKVFHILDEDNQVFGNLHHIENGQFVESCTRKNRTYLNSATAVKTYKIVLDSYAEVIDLKNEYQISLLRLPDGYSETDILYKSEDEYIATVNNGLVSPHHTGTTRIVVYTSDEKYKSYVNVLVSDN